MPESHDILCVNCGEQLDQCLDSDCTESDHHNDGETLCGVCVDPETSGE